MNIIIISYSSVFSMNLNVSESILGKRQLLVEMIVMIRHYRKNAGHMSTIHFQKLNTVAFYETNAVI
jgi:hypothetical protein